MTADHASEFAEQGFTQARGFFTPAEMREVIDEIRAAGARGLRPSGIDKGHMVFHANVFARSPRLQAFVSQQRLVDFLAPIVGPDVWVRWDQAVAKHPGGVAFPWHQDNAYNRLPFAHCQLWIALSEMTPENGGLWVEPGSHRRGKLEHRSVDGHMTWAGAPSAARFVDAGVGDVVLFSSLLLHHTTPNASADERWAYVVEYVRIGDFDPFLAPPYFVAARGGRSQPEWVESLPGGPTEGPLRRLRRLVGRALGRTPERA